MDKAQTSPLRDGAQRGPSRDGARKRPSRNGARKGANGGGDFPNFNPHPPPPYCQACRVWCDLGRRRGQSLHTRYMFAQLELIYIFKHWSMHVLIAGIGRGAACQHLGWEIVSDDDCSVASTRAYWGLYHRTVEVVHDPPVGGVVYYPWADLWCRQLTNSVCEFFVSYHRSPHSARPSHG